MKTDVKPIKFLPHDKVIDKRVAANNAHFIGWSIINNPKNANNITIAPI